MGSYLDVVWTVSLLARAGQGLLVVVCCTVATITVLEFPPRLSWEQSCEITELLELVTDLEVPGEHAVLGLGQLGDDQAEGGQGLVDVGALLQALAHDAGLDGPLAAGQVHQADLAHLETD